MAETINHDATDIQKNAAEKLNKKFDVLLKLIQKIMMNINGKAITTFTEFINIDREDIVKKTNYDSLVEMSGELFKHFSKASAGWVRRATTKNYILCFLRFACKDLGLNFKSVKKEKSETIEGKKYKRAHYFYSISAEI
ncbi:MAG: hypothetical protein Harvfovirus31_14 [Harvfovirus sp.]|uniref:Uncharacterized protein n=1 Tax=Harvfovirus sp. TaxID=2487768 RepID=A0A3G5A2E8_9VIRU|nr:MAG: hypothetical protein Harvfovirus31_14 [Harvfovirus sp.]